MAVNPDLSVISPSFTCNAIPCSDIADILVNGVSPLSANLYIKIYDFYIGIPIQNNNENKKIILIILGILILGSVFWYFNIFKKEQVIEVETEKPTMGYIAENVTATGRVEPVDTVMVGSQVSGTI